MSVTRTYTVTVVVTDSGNKYVIDNVQQDTLYLAETGTYVFNYPSAHPFRFSTTSDGTHGGGSQYTEGVTVNSSTQVQITVGASTPTLYYFCTIHSGMGGTIYTPSEDTWGALGWSTNSWGISSLTLGWGADTFNDPASTWGDVGDEIVSLTAPDAISSKVSAGSAWGDDTWGEEQSWGQFTLNVADVMGVTGVSSTATSSNDVNAGEEIFRLTGVSATGSIGNVLIWTETIPLQAIVEGTLTRTAQFSAQSSRQADFYIADPQADPNYTNLTTGASQSYTEITPSTSNTWTEEAA